MNIAVIGSRIFEDYRKLELTLDTIIEERKLTDITIVSGGAKGADTLAEKYARNRGYALIVKEADWNRYGKRAGYLRNIEMADIADLCVGFIVNDSPGSTMMLKLCADRGIEAIAIRS